MAKLGDVTIVKGCMICREEVILLAKKNTKQPLPEKDSILPEVCEDCREKYLSVGVLLINPETGSLAVIKDEAFEKIFDKPIPEGKIAFTEEEVLKQILGDDYGRKRTSMD